jgi:hypothetical protein
MALARCLLDANPGAEQRRHAQQLLEEARAIAAAHLALVQHLPVELQGKDVAPR